jgi:flagellum-specific ATP synthase
VDVLASVSRLMPQVISKEHLEWCHRFRSVLADYGKIEDLVNLGAYQKGHNRQADYAVEKIDPLNRFLRQEISELSRMEDGVRDLGRLFA